jgi:hypothetical protein
MKLNRAMMAKLNGLWSLFLLWSQFSVNFIQKKKKQKGRIDTRNRAKSPLEDARKSFLSASAS